MGLDEMLLVLLVPLALASGIWVHPMYDKSPSPQAWGRMGEGWRYFFPSACLSSILTQGKGSMV